MTIRILVALASPALLRVVEHLLRERSDIRIVGHSTSARALRGDAARLAPDLIVASTRLLGRELERRAAELKHASPVSKVLVITSDEWRGREDRRGAADASLDQEDLVRSLLPIVHTLVAGAASRAE